MAPNQEEFKPCKQEPKTMDFYYKDEEQVGKTVSTIYFEIDLGKIPEW
jgi:hypothetical protein